MNRDGSLPEPNKDSHCHSASKISRHRETSLRQLGTNRVVFYQPTSIDWDCPMDKESEVLAVGHLQGMVVYTGSSHFAQSEIAHALMDAEKRALSGLASEQSLYNLIPRTVKSEPLRACEPCGVRVIAKPTKGRSANPDKRKKLKRRRPQLAVWEEQCTGLCQRLMDVTLAGLLERQSVASLPDYRSVYGQPI